MSDQELKRLGERVAKKVASELGASDHLQNRDEDNTIEYGLAHEGNEDYPGGVYLDRSEDAIKRGLRDDS